jgi:hypothetical protein
LTAATVAFDDANESAYLAEAGGAWKGTQPSLTENPPGADNGGAGFAPWSFRGGAHYDAKSPYGRLNHFIDGVDFAASSFNALGAPSFGLTNANQAGAATARATRPLLAPLGVGDVLELRFDNPLLQSFVGSEPASFIIRLNSGGGPAGLSGAVERFGMFASDGFNGDRWAAADAAGVSDLELSTTTTSAGATFRFTLDTASTYLMEILPLGGGTPLASRAGELGGQGPIDALEIVMSGNGSGNGLTGASAIASGRREFFFNNPSIQSPGLSGDYDGDGNVGGGDFLLWQRTLGSTTNLAADGSGNNVIDGPDLAVWRSAFGAAEAAAASRSAAVPEPRTWALAGAGAVGMAWVAFPRRRRR